MRNPFRYGSRVGGNAFFDRAKIMRDILCVADGGNNAVLYGPRRYGKTSLIGEVISTLRGKGWVCIETNIMDMASLDDFIAQYAKAVYREASPALGTIRHVADLFKRVSPKVGMDEEGRPELKFEVTSRKAGIDVLRDVLELPAKICPKGKTLIVFDEFQEVESFGLGAQFERTMRSAIQNHTDISYVFLGSKTHMLERMFNTPSRPFYNSAQKFLLARPPENEGIDFVVSRFDGEGVSISHELAKDIVSLAGNVPYYIQALGSWTYGATSGRGASTVTAADVDEAFLSLYAAETILLENTFGSRPESQRLLMRALADEPVARFSEAYRNRHLLPPTATTNTALRRLVKESIVEKMDGVYSLTDPLLAYHLKTVHSKGNR